MKKTRLVQIRFSEQEYHDLCVLTAMLGLTASSTVRMLIRAKSAQLKESRTQ